MSSRPNHLYIAGKGSIAAWAIQRAAEALGSNRVYAVPVKSDPGHDTWFPSVVSCARSLGVNIVGLPDAQRDPDALFLSLEYDRIVKPERFESAALYNVHFSHLPKYKGCLTSIWPILNGESHSGVTLHEIDPGIDTGRVVHQIRFPIDESWTARDLFFEYHRQGIELLAALAFPNFRSLDAEPQPAKGSTYYGRHSIDFSNLEVEPRATAEQIRNQVRAFYFPEYQCATFEGRRVAEAKIRGERSTAKPGDVLRRDGFGAVVASVDFDVELVFA